ncbi:malto-oligosyltrehalose synthase [Aquabacter spiritensis]|uniref:Maltooligosyl trehalose synthase n=1 Tax=Aquabacter spiritensis TaxID=933073 RepID=A0A4R3LYC3_9HYPH|nr:malto-oligosyltrehalose synthase [Aquabacter spiritensis]TCT05533.1 maltooligosyl trehalose synthase [Aquabacter spiritensis]
MRTPRATVRLQFHRDFPLDAAIPLVDYFADLGISHIYSSPLLTSRPGSNHGYDTVDHGTLDPELGGEAALGRLVAKLRGRGMGLILDIVPNHMGVGGPDNRVWLDVLEWGRESAYADVFDINWTPADAALVGKVLVPVLGAPYGNALRDGTITLAYDAERGEFQARHYDHVFPICPRLYGEVLAAADMPDLVPLRDAFAAVPAERAGKAEALQLKERLAMRVADAGVDWLAPVIAAHDATAPDGCRRLHLLLEKQNFRLAWWRTANDDLNWRRFFDITELAGVQVERQEVFEQAHALVFRLYADGLVDGFRVDHVDGISDPAAYCRRLRRRLDQLDAKRPHDAPPGGYLVVEKILHQGEPLPDGWQVDGTTGYDFMDEVGAVLHDPDADEALDLVWSRATGDATPYGAQLEAARRQVLRDGFGAEMQTATRAFHRVAREDLDTRDITLAAIRRALNELVVAFPVYRTYVDASGRSDQDWTYLSAALAQARRRLPPIDHPVLDLIDGWLGGEAQRGLGDVLEAGTRGYAIAKFQQLTAPIAAKSVEDTLFYRYGRLLSRNEVGSDPAQMGLSPSGFHAAATARATRFPGAMLATATHDHKRGEDARMRLAVLSEIPNEWSGMLEELRTLVEPLRRALPSGSAPAPADAVMLLQTLIGAWPPTLSPDDAAGLAAYAERVAGWQLKAMREAKVHTNWIFPDTVYEGACAGFLSDLMTAPEGESARAAIAECATRLAPAGAVNSLAQTVLKFTVPGMPDLYQGTEFWDFSLVDPDNRRPVDYPARIAAFEAGAAPAALLEAWRDGRIKQAVIARLLQARAANPALFADGSYEPLAIEGPGAGQALAFLRRHAGTVLLVTVTRRAAAMLGPGAALPLISAEAWGETALVLPNGLPACLDDLLGDERLAPAAGRIPLARLFGRLPVAALLGRSTAASAETGAAVPAL